jgi:hypothetical protein
MTEILLVFISYVVIVLESEWTITDYITIYLQTIPLAAYANKLFYYNYMRSHE